MNRFVLFFVVTIGSFARFSYSGLCTRSNVREISDYAHIAASDAGAGVGHPRKASKTSHRRYEIHDLGTLGADTGGPILTVPKDINEKGQVVGYSLTSDGRRHGFVWERGDGIRDLGALGYERSAATCINEDGRIAGYAGDNDFSTDDPEWISVALHPRTRRLFVGDYDGGIRSVGKVMDKCDLLPLHLNNRGDVIGSLYSAVNKHTELFIWAAGKGMQTISLPETFEKIIPLGGNSRRQVVGYYVDTEGRHAFIWDKSNGLTDLSQELGSKYCKAHAINDKRQVVGQSFTRSKRQDSAFIWDKTSGVRELGVLGGDRSVAYGLNNCGAVVGSSSIDETCSTDCKKWHAFLWSRSTGMSDLNDGLRKSSLFLCLECAIDINNAGQIIGYGRVRNGQRRGFVMSPTDMER